MVIAWGWSQKSDDCMGISWWFHRKWGYPALYGETTMGTPVKRLFSGPCKGDMLEMWGLMRNLRLFWNQKQDSWTWTSRRDLSRTPHIEHLLKGPNPVEISYWTMVSGGCFYIRGEGLFFARYLRLVMPLCFLSGCWSLKEVRLNHWSAQKAAIA